MQARMRLNHAPALPGLFFVKAVTAVRRFETPCDHIATGGVMCARGAPAWHLRTTRAWLLSADYCYYRPSGSRADPERPMDFPSGLIAPRSTADAGSIVSESAGRGPTACVFCESDWPDSQSACTRSQTSITVCCFATSTVRIRVAVPKSSVACGE